MVDSCHVTQEPVIFDRRASATVCFSRCLVVQTTVKTVNCHAYLSSQWAKHFFGSVDIDLFKIAIILTPFT